MVKLYNKNEVTAAAAAAAAAPVIPAATLENLHKRPELSITYSKIFFLSFSVLGQSKQSLDYQFMQ